MRGRDRIAILLAGGATALVPALAIAAETIVYRYDARGRLVQVERNQAVSNNVVTNYSFDKADNRLVKTTTGSPNPPPP
jgi:YD repeat-containing protein